MKKISLNRENTKTAINWVKFRELLNIGVP